MDTNNQDNNYETTTVTPVETNEVPVEQPIQQVEKIEQSCF